MSDASKEASAVGAVEGAEDLRALMLKLGTATLVLVVVLIGPLFLFLEWSKGDGARQELESSEDLALARILKKINTGGGISRNQENYEVRWTAHDGVERSGVLQLQRGHANHFDIAKPGQEWYIRISPSDPYEISFAREVARHEWVEFAGFHFSRLIWTLIGISGAGLAFLLIGLCIPPAAKRKP